ncbi:unnamed protein product [Somion occarium]|uniref:Protein kinase domain-containing protein n=1 Tax=Somion occarium TaxID=3059160 RepID=A0ABP1DLU3_9APHY
MLQYTVQLPPLSLSSSKHSKPSKSAPKSSSRDLIFDDQPRPTSSTSTLPHNASSTTPAIANSFNSKRGPLAYDKLVPARPAAYSSVSHHAVPLAISTSTATSTSPLSSGPASSSSGSASPSLHSAKPMLRSPLVSSSRQQLSSPVTSPRQLASPSPVPTHRQLSSVTGTSTRSPHPLKANLPSLNGSRPGTGTTSRPSTGTRPDTTPGFDNSGYFSTRSQSRSRSSSLSSTLADVLSAGELVGEGLSLQGEIVRKVPIPAPHSDCANEDPAPEFEVVRKLGTGSYAVVYLVREVLGRTIVSGSPSSSVDGHIAAVGRMDFDSESEDGHGFIRKEKEERIYGREYAVKVLSKANLDEDALEAQLFEATLHQSLRPHANIVTLHRTLETASFLLLLLEFVPGEDLFYFLEQSRDHYSPTPLESSTSPTSSSPGSPGSPSSGSSTHTPPTPSLLSSLHPSHLLSHTRLRLIASMFSQMCDAVAACHEQKVFHRDIKPENFIVTDAWVEKPGAREGEVRKERKVVVKLTDFGLGTMDEESADMDCGSAPYMSFECRNNIHPTYSPRAADVWSLGIVLINMLYHYNPWSDTTEGICPSFELYLRDPVNFFMTRFTGMTLPVAEFLTKKVFCILEDPKDDSARVAAKEFGRWARDLPVLFNASSHGHAGHKRNVSISSTVGYTLASVPQSRRPSLRHAPYSGDRTSWALGGSSRAPSQRASWAMSRQPSFVGAGGSSLSVAVEETSMEMAAGSMLPPLLDVDQLLVEEPEQEQELEGEVETEPQSRSASTQKRRKRGARKASQALAREISRTSRSSGQPLDSQHPHHVVPPHIPPSSISALSLSMSMSSNSPAHSVSVLPTLPSQTSQTSSSSVQIPSSSTASLSGMQLSASGKSSNSRRPPILNTSSANASAAVTTPTTPTSISKKPSKWKLGFGKGSQSHSNPPPPPLPSSQSENLSNGGQSMSTTASNVTNLLMGLNAPPPSTTSHYPKRTQQPPSNKSQTSLEENPAWSRGRRAGKAAATWGPSQTSSAFGATGPYQHSQNNSSTVSWTSSSNQAINPNGHHQAGSTSSMSVNERDRRAVSPSSTKSGKPLASSASSMASSNWRSSMSSTGASSSSSAFTRYSNGSTRSVSTAATSVSSASSWRSGGSKYPYDTPGQLPPNVKLMTGTPWELDQLPRQMYINPDEARFGAPPPPKRRAPKKDSTSSKLGQLGTIDEWPPNQKTTITTTAAAATTAAAVPSSSLAQRQDAATSTTDLGRERELSNGSSREGDGPGGDASSPRKVQKGQINALAKMLSALRR